MHCSLSPYWDRHVARCSSSAEIYPLLCWLRCMIAWPHGHIMYRGIATRCLRTSWFFWHWLWREQPPWWSWSGHATSKATSTMISWDSWVDGILWMVNLIMNDEQIDQEVMFFSCKTIMCISAFTSDSNFVPILCTLAFWCGISHFKCWFVLVGSFDMDDKLDEVVIWFRPGQARTYKNKLYVGRVSS